MRNNEHSDSAEVEKLIEAYANITFTAENLICGDRNKQYGKPIDDFFTTAEFWTTWAQSRGLMKPEAFFVPEDVAAMQVLLKLSRESRVHKLDSLVDGAGYFGTLGMVIAERLRRGLGAAYSKLTKRPWE
jgi:hypothetical protein